jgi:hypothetical protein
MNRLETGFVLLFTAVLSFGHFNRVAAQGAPAPSAQQILNLLASPATATTPSSGLPSSFAAWSADQQRTVPKQIEGRCTVLWTMMNGGGKVQLLPASEEPQDNAKLALDACTAAQMPSDWPPRRGMLADVDQILERAKTLGEILSLPPALKH